MKESFSLGLTSVTFRQKSIREVAELAARAGLSLVEWGADIHVQPGDRDAAKEAVRQMSENGLSCPSYGTYYRIGDRDTDAFLRLCESAEILGAKTLRLWLGRKASADCTEEDFSALVEETETLADLADKHGLTVAFEYHGKTFSDEAASHLRFFSAVTHANVRSYWQPLAFGDSEENLRASLPHLSTVHVFHWDTENNRFPLADGAEQWRGYLDILRGADVYPPLIMEFVRDDKERQFLTDAKTLHEMIK